VASGAGGVALLQEEASLLGGGFGAPLSRVLFLSASREGCHPISVTKLCAATLYLEPIQRRLFFSTVDLLSRT
jgi:hypothetical protein